jgi:hypothetical protein
VWRQPLAWLNVAVLVLLVSGYSNADQGQTAQIHGLEERVGKLERLVDAAKHQVVAPFVINDERGNPIVRVDDQHALSFYWVGSQVPVAALRAQLGGSVLILRNNDDSSSIALGATEAKEPAIKIRTDSKLRAVVGATAGGHGLIAVYGQDGADLAAGLESQPDWKGRVAAYIKGSFPVAYMAESEKHPGGGNVIMADPDGNKVFAAGYMGDGNGGACIMKKGEAHCMAISLPGM